MTLLNRILKLVLVGQLVLSYHIRVGAVKGPLSSQQLNRFEQFITSWNGASSLEQWTQQLQIPVKEQKLFLELAKQWGVANEKPPTLEMNMTEQVLTIYIPVGGGQQKLRILNFKPMILKFENDDEIFNFSGMNAKQVVARLQKKWKSMQTKVSQIKEDEALPSSSSARLLNSMDFKLKMLPYHWVVPSAKAQMPSLFSGGGGMQSSMLLYLLGGLAIFGLWYMYTKYEEKEKAEEKELKATERAAPYCDQLISDLQGFQKKSKNPLQWFECHTKKKKANNIEVFHSEKKQPIVYNFDEKDQFMQPKEIGIFVGDHQCKCLWGKYSQNYTGCESEDCNFLIKNQNWSSMLNQNVIDEVCATKGCPDKVKTALGFMDSSGVRKVANEPQTRTTEATSSVTKPESRESPSSPPATEESTGHGGGAAK